MSFVDGAAVLTYVGSDAEGFTPSEADEDWADIAAAAVDAAITTALEDPDLSDSDQLVAELTWAAIVAAGEAYKRRDAPFGVTGYEDAQGAAVRVARDYLTTIGPILDRYRIPGIG